MMEIVPKVNDNITSDSLSIKSEVIALKNNEYHTASNIITPDTSSSTEAYDSQITPTNIIITFNDVSVTYNPKEATELTEMNFFNAFSNLSSRIIQEFNLQEEECSCDLTPEQTEKLIKIIAMSFNDDFAAAQQYVKNDYNDGLDDSAFDLLTYASATDSPLKFMNPGLGDSTRSSEFAIQ